MCVFNKAKKDKKTFISISVAVALSTVSFACSEKTPDKAENNVKTTKPVEYVTSVNLLALATSDVADTQTPWNAKDTELLTLARALPAQSEVIAVNDIPGLPPNFFPNTISETVIPCTGGGTRTTIIDNQAPPWPSQGDINTVVYDNCVNGGTTMNGQRSSLVEVMIGQQFIDPDWSLTTTVSRDITRTANVTGNVSSVVGESSESMTVTNNTNYLQVSSGSWVNVRPNNGVDVEDTVSHNITYAWEDTPTGTYQWDFEVQTASTNPIFPDAVTKSLVTLTGPNTQPPEIGKIEITKTYADVQLDPTSNIVNVTTITALGAGAVLIEIDMDNDGVIDSSVESTWSQVMLDPMLYQYF